MLDRCSLCSRDFDKRELRNSPLPGGSGKDMLCQSCWQVLCAHPWPLEGGSMHGASNAGATFATHPSNHHQSPGSYPNSPGLPSSFQHQQNALGQQQQPGMQRRSQSIPSFQTLPGAAPIRTARPIGWQPNSMPEQQRNILYSNSHEGDGRYYLGGGGGGGSAPANPASILAAGPEARQHGPPSFSPFELRNMLDENSLELFESQSHLLDPESRAALTRQRQYLQWQSSMDEPGPMQSVLERQESAGSGCNEPSESPGYEYSNGNGAAAGSGPLTVEALLKEVDGLRNQLSTASREREVLLGKIQELERDVETHREARRCKMCRKTARNCVILPCLHFTTCDGCFKQHCAVAAPTCPECNNGVTGFQTLLF